MKTRIIAIAALVAILIALAAGNNRRQHRASEASQGHTLDVSTSTSFGK